MILEVVSGAGAAIAAAAIIGVVALAWKNFAAYRRLAATIRSAVIPATCFSLGMFAAGDGRITLAAVNWYIVILGPAAVWLALWSWGAVTRDLQGKPLDGDDGPDDKGTKR